MVTFSVRHRRRLRIAALAVVTVFGVGSCGSTNEPVATIVATDLVGREVRLAEPAKRVVAIPIPAASMLVAVNGGPEVLAGMNPSAKLAIEQGYLGQIFPQLKDVPSNVSTKDFAPIMENLLSVDPDLVIQWGDEGAGLVDPLLNSGLAVAQLKYGTQQYLEQAALLYGRLLGKEDRAQELVSRMQSRMAELQQTPAPGNRPTTVHLSGIRNGLTVAGASSYNNFVIDLAGGRNPASGMPETKAAVDLEQILAWNPEIIFIGNFDPSVPEDLYSDPKWQSVTAVREKQVYKVPLGGYRWDPPSQESPLFWQWAAGIIRTGSVPATLQATIREHYGFLYGNQPDDAQISSILQTTANANSRAYTALAHGN
ncbi:ABC transporter substrate-binding protein [Nocardia sp. IBHARD005]|uniref:ABC transporter substrate-binding protein n=1 Tax=Nocardia sp. IBHARD005 TaxID=3457765 RepID=UPI004059DD62